MVDNRFWLVEYRSVSWGFSLVRHRLVLVYCFHWFVRVPKIQNVKYFSKNYMHCAFEGRSGHCHHVPQFVNL